MEEELKKSREEASDSRNKCERLEKVVAGFCLLFVLHCLKL